MVSAPIIAKHRGISFSTVRHERPCDYQTLLRLTVEGQTRTRVIAGTLFAGTEPRLIDIQGIKVEAEFAERMLYIRNYDKPGFIGALGTLLGNEGINIATFHLGRRDSGGEALALVEIEGDINQIFIALTKLICLVLIIRLLNRVVLKVLQTWVSKKLLRIHYLQQIF